MSIADIANSLGGLIPLIAGAGGIVSGARFVQEGQRGIKLRFGKVVRNRDGQPRIIRPGFCFVWPAVETVRRTHVRAMTFNFPDQAVMLADGTVFHVSAVVVCRLHDDDAAIYRALFDIDDLPGSVSDFCASTLRDVLAGLTHDQINNQEAVLDAVKAKVVPQLTLWGVHLDRFMLTDCSPSPDTARLVLIGAEAAFRAEALLAVAAKLDGSAVGGLDPMVAAAVIGTPVSVALSGRGAGGGGSAGSIEDDDDDD